MLRAMADDALVKLNEREMTELLQQAASREGVDRSRPFTRNDLLEAGDELGLNREVLEAAYHTYLARKRDGTLRPQGTAIHLDIAADRLTLYVPGRGLRLPQFVRFMMGFFMLAFITFWTAGALRGGVVFAAFSTPFWMASIYILFTAARSTWQTTRLELGPNGGRLIQQPFGRIVALRPEHLLVTDGTRPPSLLRTHEPAVPSVVLEHGTRSYFLLEALARRNAVGSKAHCKPG